MNARRIAFAVLLSFATAGLAAEPKVNGFKLYSLPAYRLVTNDEHSARVALSAVAKADKTMTGLLPRSEYARHEPTFVLIVPNVLWTRYLSPGKGFYDNFFPGRFANYVMVNYVSEIDTRVAREFCHLYLHTQFDGIVPVWFDEGVATYTANVWFGRRLEYTGDFGPESHSISDEQYHHLSTLLGLDRNSSIYLDAAGRQGIGQTTWTIVELGLVTDRRDAGKKLLALVAAQSDLQPPEKAVRSSFGMSLEEFRAFSNPYNSSVALGIKTPSSPPAPDLPAGRAMNRIEALELIADIMLESGLNAAHLPEVVAAIERQSPGSPTATAWRMRLSARSGDAATLQSLVAKLGPDTNDPVLIRGAGLALFDDVQRTKQDRNSAAALDLLDRAIMSRPDDVEAIWAYSMLASQMQRDLPIAARRIQSARSILPFNPYLAQASALVYGAMGDAPRMRQATEDALKFSKTPDMTRWAKSQLESNPAKN